MEMNVYCLDVFLSCYLFWEAGAGTCKFLCAALPRDRDETLPL